MLGHPKYNKGDIVKFEIRWKEDDGSVRIETHTGIIAIIDPYGTFFQQEDVSYDILNKEENMLYKHMMEPSIIEKIGESDPNQIWK